MAIRLWQACCLVFPAVILFNLYYAPFTKVEESFNIQAIHDILHHGVPIENAALKFQALFDHITFRGAVPRTFIGALITSAVAKPLIWLDNHTGSQQQLCARGVLGLLNASALIVFTRAAAKAYGPVTALWFTIIQASQFHLIFYASRTLPNVFAFCLSTYALAALLPDPQSLLGQLKRTRLAFYLLTLATVIFRAELVLLIGAHGLYMLMKSSSMASRIAMIRTTFFPSILAGALVGLLITVSVDTHFWQSSKLLWPEFEAFMSNVFPTGDDLGASAWGTSPWHWYFTSALPRIFMFNFPLLLASPLFNRDWRAMDHLVPSLLYTALYSFLPHKETRFLFPVIPSLSLYLALVITRLQNLSRNYSWFSLLVYASFITSLATSIFSLAILLPISANNYPGGSALQELHLYHHLYGAPSIEQPQIHVHLTNLALQSGITRFLEQPDLSHITRPTKYVPIKAIPQKSDAYAAANQPILPPIVLPGSPDGRLKPLTIQPSGENNPPQPTQAPRTVRPTPPPRYIYDKTSNSTSFLLPSFWAQLDYAIVENPSQVIGSWEIVGTIRGLGRPRIAPADETGSMLEPLEAMYGETLGGALAGVNYVAKRVLAGRLGGRWIEWDMVDRLYILRDRSRDTYDAIAAERDAKQERMRGVGVKSADGQTESAGADGEEQGEEVLGLPSEGANEKDGNGNIFMDDLGPLVVNKDGTLSRLDNWAGMTPRERERTVKYLRERNQLRLQHVVEREERRE